MKFANRYEMHKPTGEKNSGEIITEYAGYIPAEQQIKNIIKAGNDLNLYRLGLTNGFAQKSEETGEVPEMLDPQMMTEIEKAEYMKNVEAEAAKIAAAQKEAFEKAQKEAFDKAVEAEVAKKMAEKPENLE